MLELPTCIRLRYLIALVSLSCLAAACSPIRDNEARKADAGEACASDLDCGAALVCTNGRICTQVGEPGTADRGEDCISDESCRLGLNCNARGLCDRTVPRAVDARCTSQAGCDTGLVCSHSGRCTDPEDPEATGIATEDATCSLAIDCALGLTCGPESTCIPFQPWTGVECDTNAVGEAPQVIFNIPRSPGEGDFFSLPYPNNIRRTGYALDLSHFPGTASGDLPHELLAPYAFLNEGPTTGYGTNPSVIFRFNTPVDYSSLAFGGDNANFLFVDITPDSPGYGLAPRSRYYATGAGNPFTCPNWLGIRPSEGSPLAGGRTYAVLFLEGILNTDGVPLEASPDFLAMLNDTSPGEPALLGPWRSYRSLRRYLDEQGLSDQVVGGTVFTTGQPQSYLAGVRNAVYAAPAPTIVSNSVCGSGPPSPCSLEGDRQCAAADPDDDFIEVHAIAQLPSYLDGAAPYAEGGGRAHIDHRTGRPYIQGVENVCLSISIPTGTPPEGGWPTAIFAHDFGGHFRTGVRRQVAKSLASNERGAKWATIGFDAVLHGPRSGTGQNPSAEELADQILNPYKAGLFLDHALQGVSDLHALVRLLSGGAVAGLGSPNSRLSGSRIAVVAHGMGADIAVPFLAFEPLVEAAVLASVSGNLVNQLRFRQTPVNHQAEMVLALGDEDLNGMHPGLHLMQQRLDGRDPVNYADLLRRPPEGLSAKHLLVMYGRENQQFPDESGVYSAFPIALRAPIVGPALEELSPVSPAEGGSLQGNVGGATQGLLPYSPRMNGDGHDVMFEHPNATVHLRRFLGELLTAPDGVPSLQR